MTDTLKPAELDLEALKKVALEASPGPWTLDEEWIQYEGMLRPSHNIHSAAPSPDGRIICNVDIWRHDPEGTHENARHIATFDPPTVLRLISAARDQGRAEGSRPSEGGSVHPDPNPSAHVADATATEALCDLEALGWLSEQTNLELSFEYPGDEGDPGEWQVHRVSGGRNDREWELVGNGSTALSAILSARSRLSTSRPEGGR